MRIQQKQWTPLLRTVLFLLPLLLLLFLLSPILRPKDNQEAAGMEEHFANGILAEPANSIDVLIIGDSESYCSFSPVQLWEEQGVTSYVCGSSGQYLFESVDYLKKTFQTQHPKLVVLEVNNVFRKVKLEQMLYNEAANLIPALRYHDRWKQLKKADFASTVAYTYRTPYKGYRLRRKAVDGTDEEYMERKKKPRRITATNQYYLERLQKLCSKQGVELVLVSAPSTKNWNRAKHNSVRDYAQTHGLTYLDMNVINHQVNINWAKDSFDGGDHLNIYGSQKVTSFFGGWLTQQYQLEKHDSDSIAEDWNTLIEPYHKELEKGIKS